MDLPVQSWLAGRPALNQSEYRDPSQSSRRGPTGTNSTLREPLAPSQSRTSCPELQDAYSFLSALGAPKDPSLVWNKKPSNNPATTAGADLGIWAAEQFETFFQQPGVQQTRLVQAPVFKAANAAHEKLQHLPQPKPTASDELHRLKNISKADGKPKGQYRDKGIETQPSRSVEVTGRHAAVLASSGPASYRPRSVHAAQQGTMQLQLKRSHPAVSAAPNRLTIINDKKLKQRDMTEPRMQPAEGVLAAQFARTDAAAAAVSTSMTGRLDSSKHGPPRAQKRSWETFSQQALEKAPSVEDPDTPDAQESPPQVFKRCRHDHEMSGHSAEAGMRVGAVVWAKLGKHPYWPAKVAKPNPSKIAALKAAFETLNSRPVGKDDIHVAFFADGGASAFVPVSCVESFSKCFKRRSSNQEVADTDAVREAQAAQRPQRPAWRC